jgi:hypothetical protein
MAPVAKRTHLGHTSDAQLGGSGSASDIYAVYDSTPGTGVSIGQIYSGAFLIEVGVPTLGNFHPELGARLRVQSLSRQPAGNGWEVTVNYASASGSSNRQPLDPLAPSFTSIEETSRRDDVEFPVFERRKITVPSEDSTAVEKLVWDLSDTENIERRDVRVLTAVVSGQFGTGPQGGGSLTIGSFVNIFPAVGNQINKLHTIGGQRWRFVGLQRLAQETESTPDEPAKWSVRYEWEQDPGIFNATGLNPQSGIVIIEGKGFVCQDPGYRIRPYTAFYTGGDPDDPELPPVATFLSNVVEDENGWTTLPGILG